MTDNLLIILINTISMQFRCSLYRFPSLEASKDCVEKEVFIQSDFPTEKVFCAQEYDCNSIFTNQLKAGDICKARE
jgi:hypothetical protein